MYSISNQQRDVLIRAVELLRKQPVKGLREVNIVRMATIAARKLQEKKPMEEER